MTTTPASDIEVTPRRGYPIVAGTRCDFELGRRIFIIDRARKESEKKGIFYQLTKDNSAVFTMRLSMYGT